MERPCPLYYKPSDILAAFSPHRAPEADLPDAAPARPQSIVAHAILFTLRAVARRQAARRLDLGLVRLPARRSAGRGATRPLSDGGERLGRGAAFVPGRTRRPELLSHFAFIPRAAEERTARS